MPPQTSQTGRRVGRDGQPARNGNREKPAPSSFPNRPKPPKPPARFGKCATDARSQHPPPPQPAARVDEQTPALRQRPSNPAKNPPRTSGTGTGQNSLRNTIRTPATPTHTTPAQTNPPLPTRRARTRSRKRQYRRTTQPSRTGAAARPALPHPPPAPTNPRTPPPDG